MKYQSHPLKYVIPTVGYELICQFKNGETKVFNMEPVFKKIPKFNELKDGSFFNAKVDLGGLCVTFTDELDLSEETLYQHGVLYDAQKESAKLQKELYLLCKKCRKTQKVTQKTLSDYSNIPQSGIARIESGKSDVHLSTLLNYLTTLGLKLTITKK